MSNQPVTPDVAADTAAELSRRVRRLHQGVAFTAAGMAHPISVSAAAADVRQAWDHIAQLGSVPPVVWVAVYGAAIEHSEPRLISEIQLATLTAELRALWPNGPESIIHALVQGWCRH